MRPWADHVIASNLSFLPVKAFLPYKDRRAVTNDAVTNGDVLGGHM